MQKLKFLVQIFGSIYQEAVSQGAEGGVSLHCHVFFEKWHQIEEGKAALFSICDELFHDLFQLFLVAAVVKQRVAI